MKKLLVVDGSNLLCQMFFGISSSIIDKNGKAIHGTFGFVSALIRIIKLTKPTHVIVIFDGGHKNSRVNLAHDYKTNRGGYANAFDDKSPFSQLNDIYAALDFMKIRHYEADVLEADDDVAGYAFTYGKDMKVVISSLDSDFFQLINGNVSVLRYRGNKSVICDAEYIKNKFGILPEQYADFKSLTGDGSDNIKGAKKIGIKTAAALIKQFGSLRNLIKNADQISTPHIRESIIQSAERLQINYKLIKLYNSAVKFDIDDCMVSDNSLGTNEVLNGIGLL